MKNYFIILSIIGSFSCLGVEPESKLICNGAYCEKVTKVKNVGDTTELKMNQITVGSCLVDLAKNETSKVLEADNKSLKIVTVVEDKDLNLRKVTTFYDKKDFNRAMKIIPCTQTETQVLNDPDKTAKCLSSAGKHVQKYYCEKERRKNF